MAATENRWGNKSRLASLFTTLYGYLKKGGLRQLGNDLSTFKHFVSDIIHRRYKNYSIFTLLLSIAALIYAISPLDFIPDLLPVFGVLDDITIATWALSQLGGELHKYKDEKENKDIKELDR